MGLGQRGAAGVLAAVVVSAMGFVAGPAQAEGRAARCLELAGPVDAGLPLGPEDAARRKAALAAAAADCEAAGTEAGANAEALFWAGEVARAKGQAGVSFGLFERAAALGLAAAETRLGDFYTYGVAPGGKDPAAAARHYQAAAEGGDPAGMTTLALMYRLGQGVARDPGRMVELMTQAAAAGYGVAAYGLAGIYRDGEGIVGGVDAALGIPDAGKAAGYLAQAAQAGVPGAALEAAALYGPAGLDDPGEEARLTRMVARTGDGAAIAAMGVLYETGRGVEAAPEVAAGLYIKALESGDVTVEALRAGAARRWEAETARAFQRALKARGLYRGGIDGDIGGGTLAAARRLAAGGG